MPTDPIQQLKTYVASVTMRATHTFVVEAASKREAERKIRAGEIEDGWMAGDDRLASIQSIEERR